MFGLVFSDPPPPVASAPERNDVACVVGLVAVRERLPRALAAAIVAWQRAAGWAASLPPTATAALQTAGADVATVDVLRPGLPILFDDWGTFDLVFAWDRRPDGAPIPTATGLAVRAYFANGGARCLVVAAGPALALAPPGQPEDIARLLVPPDTSPLDRANWRGLAHLYGLPEVSFACLPDLPEIVASTASTPPVEIPPEPVSKPIFDVCDHATIAGPAPTVAAARPRPPTSTLAGYERWADHVRRAAELIARYRRDVQLVVALPLPAPDMEGRFPHRLADLGFLGERDGALPGLGSSHVQVGWPWLQLAGSGAPAGWPVAPDGVIAGMLSHNARVRGTWRNAGGLGLARVQGTWPPAAPARWTLGPRPPVSWLSLIGPTPSGHALLSDVTTSPEEAHRLANVNRLTMLLLRTVRRLGEEFTFEASHPTTWARLQGALDARLTQLWEEGAISGATEADAFTVRTGRATSTANDLDEGRLRVEIAFTPSHAIEQITVVLRQTEAGWTAGEAP